MQANSSEVVRLGVHVIHPLTKDSIPIAAVAGFDLRSHDGVAVLCPAHQRPDARLAALVDINSTPILNPPTGTADAFDWDRTWIYTIKNSPLFGLTASEGEAWIIEELQRRDVGRRIARYRLRDWNIARQRYWGPPIPIIHCNDCGTVPVPEGDLPVILPLDIDLKTPGNPLDRHLTFPKASCPRCARPARRDTDTLETYSSPWWYHWNCKRTTTLTPFNKEEARLYMPVDIMIGGEDQARTCFFHLRMMARALKRAGVVEYDEPVDTLLAIGMVKSNGRKMSKTEGNTIDPQSVIKGYGADALRFAILGAAAPESDFNWSNSFVRQAQSFLHKVWHFCIHLAELVSFDALAPDACINPDYSLTRKLQRQVETATTRITEAMCQNQFHLVVSGVEQLFDRIVAYEHEAVKRRKVLDERDRISLGVAISIFLRMLSPLCPHITEELWERLGGSRMIAQSPWPAHIRTEEEAKT
jgi:leucyl-tRNA synthetase